MGSDSKKFNHIWEMNEEECKKLAKSLVEADRIIHEQQLGLPWSLPPLYALILCFINYYLKSASTTI